MATSQVNAPPRGTLSRPSRSTPEWLSRYHHATRRPAGIALTILPLALLYGLGLLVASPGARSGVDLISDELQRKVEEQGGQIKEGNERAEALLAAAPSSAGCCA